MSWVSLTTDLLPVLSPKLMSMKRLVLLLLAVPAALAQNSTNEIHPGVANPDKCLDVRADTLANGTPVQM